MGLLIVLSLLLSGIMLAPPADSGIVEVSTNALTPHAPIRINSDVDLAAEASAGNGTVWAPWVIENYEIDGSGAGYCLYIGNTTEYFEVRNCSLNNAGGISSWPDPYYVESAFTSSNIQNGMLMNITSNGNIYSAVFMANSRDCQIVDCDFSDNPGGIYFSGSTSNRIVNNTIDNCTWTGISLWDNSPNNVIENNTVSYGSHIGIMVDSGADGCLLANNTISMNGEDGIILNFADFCQVLNNTADDNGYVSISIYRSRFAVLVNNTMNNTGILLDGYTDLDCWNTHQIDQTNIMNGNPAYYLKNSTGIGVNPGYGQIILANCSETSIENQTINNATYAIVGGFCNDTYVGNFSSEGCTFGGQWFFRSSNTTVHNNTIQSSPSAIYLEESHNNTVSHCDLSNNTYSGLRMQWGSNTNKIFNNTISSNGHYGLLISSSSYSEIINNTFTDNVEGIYFGGIGNIYHNCFTMIMC